MFLSKILGPGRHPYIVISFTLKVTDQLFETPQAWSPNEPIFTGLCYDRYTKYRIADTIQWFYLSFKCLMIQKVLTLKSLSIIAYLISYSLINQIDT